jgi:hypothetical protein
MNEESKLKWITAEQKETLRGIFKHEDEIWPESYVQLWIPNDFNHYAIVLGYKSVDEDGKKVLVAGFQNPFSASSEPTILPGDEYKYWCETPGYTEEVKTKREQILIEQDKGNWMYSYPPKEE